MESPNPDHFWKGRQRLTEILAPFELDVLAWLCLEASSRWVKWDAPLGGAIYRDVVIEDFWSYDSRSSSVYLPDITAQKTVRADESIRRKGLVQRVDNDIAESMLAEKRAYEYSDYDKHELLDLRVLSTSGLEIWNAVRQAQGFGTGLRFIKLISRSRISPNPGEAGSINDPESRSIHRGMVLHSPFEFRPEQLCDECAAGIAQGEASPFAEVGPWFDRGNEIWLNGWRLICPHAV